jgi:hypothetical protein
MPSHRGDDPAVRDLTAGPPDEVALRRRESPERRRRAGSWRGQWGTHDRDYFGAVFPECHIRENRRCPFVARGPAQPPVPLALRTRHPVRVLGLQDGSTPDVVMSQDIFVGHSDSHWGAATSPGPSLEHMFVSGSNPAGSGSKRWLLPIDQ